MVNDKAILRPYTHGKRQIVVIKLMIIVVRLFSYLIKII